ncbi:PEP-CTERM sorting domain-containing protein [Xylophilus rhododendri]|uniref:PEP-CTERM sorting domain-containing protein n=1 Tax=Xylophilus rhododendri TaxID=2697032 RepID=A0A857JDW4_9BURK|nr:FxDxF family PEP-CTERM protein [Xylophilus rhododendri]QHJ00866.1 PEP-CTERM sorting domain-containing protein [Xylophilus rhododendri]
MSRNALKKTALVALLTLGSALSASAATYDLGVLSLGTTYEPSSTVSPSFSDIFNFTIGSMSAASMGSLALIVSGGGTVINSISLFDGTTTTTGTVHADAVASTGYLSTVLKPGISYSLKVAGIGTGDYMTTFRVAAIPEPETYAMLLAGVGVMGMLVRQRQKRSRG